MGEARGWLAVGVACASLAACGGNGGGAAGGSDAGVVDLTTVEGFCAAVVSGIAGPRQRLLRRARRRLADARRGRGRHRAVPQWSKGAAASRIAYDASQAQGCLDALPSVPCPELIGGPQPAACRSALAGQVPSGGACFADSECAGDATICDLAATCPGACLARVPAGGSCAEAGAVCAFGSSCVAGACTEDAGAGQPCSEELPCKFGLVCLAQASGATTGTCEPEQAGGACFSSLQCLPTFACAGPDGASECAPAKAEGGPAPSGSSSATCSPPASTAGCQAFPSLGGACDHPAGARGEGSDCLQGVCAGGQCMPLLEQGQACQQGRQCASGLCADGACAAACVGP
jgi:hypothetical protein